MSVLLDFSVGVVTGDVGGWEYWDEGGERLEEKVFVIHYGWGQRGKGPHSRFPAIEMRRKMGGLNPRRSRKYVGLLSSYLLPWDKLPLSC